MALKATIFKIQIQVNDVARHYYNSHNVVVARHASETDERMMVRLLAYALNADDRLEFGRGLSTEDEPDLQLKAYSGETDCWIDVGRPSIDRIKKACGRAKKVSIYCYGGNAAEIWWQEVRTDLLRFSHLTVFNLSGTQDLAQLVDRTMSLQCTVNDGIIWLMNNSQTVCVEYAELS